MNEKNTVVANMVALQWNLTSFKTAVAKHYFSESYCLSKRGSQLNIHVINKSMSIQVKRRGKGSYKIRSISGQF